MIDLDQKKCRYFNSKSKEIKCIMLDFNKIGNIKVYFKLGSAGAIYTLFTDAKKNYLYSKNPNGSLQKFKMRVAPYRTD